MDRQTALDHLREFHAETLERRTTEAVAAARNAGATWREIAEALGTTQPYAVRKYRPRLTEHRQVTVRTDAEGSTR